MVEGYCSVGAINGLNKFKYKQPIAVGLLIKFHCVSIFFLQFEFMLCSVRFCLSYLEKIVRRLYFDVILYSLVKPEMCFLRNSYSWVKPKIYCYDKVD